VVLEGCEPGGSSRVKESMQMLGVRLSDRRYGSVGLTDLLLSKQFTVKCRAGHSLCTHL